MEGKMREPALLDPWVQGYLEYMGEVSRRTPGTVKDVKCTLKRVSRAMEEINPNAPLWKATFEDYMRWLREERDEGASDATLAKMVSHVRGFLDYSWRSGRTDRNVLDGFSLHDRVEAKEPDNLTLEEAAGMVNAYSRRTKAERRSRVICQRQLHLLTDDNYTSPVMVLVRTT
jgi:site-specific recombinase XerD